MPLRERSTGSCTLTGVTFVVTIFFYSDGVLPSTARRRCDLVAVVGSFRRGTDNLFRSVLVKLRGSE